MLFGFCTAPQLVEVYFDLIFLRLTAVGVIGDLLCAEITDEVLG